MYNLTEYVFEKCPSRNTATEYHHILHVSV